jgi:hypothetical protein
VAGSQMDTPATQGALREKVKPAIISPGFQAGPDVDVITSLPEVVSARGA